MELPQTAGRLRSLLEARLGELEARSYASWLAAEDGEPVPLTADPTGPLALCWVERLHDERVRVVLQACERGGCCVQDAPAVGFLIDPSGHREPVPQALMDEFQLQPDGL